MVYRASLVSQEPLDYFLRHGEEESRLHISDVVLRIHHSRWELSSYFIRLATNSKWSHSALVYTINDPTHGLENIFLIEAKTKTKGVKMASWRNEVLPYKEFTVGIKRPKLDWYQESPDEAGRHNASDPEDKHAITYLRHVGSIALDQINGLYDNKVVWELAALYAARVARRHVGMLPRVARAADRLAQFMKKWDAKEESQAHVRRFVCSGLVQYSFFAALRFRLLHDLQIPERHASALHNLRNMQHILYRDDPEEVMARYIKRLITGEQDLADSVPNDVQDLLKTATPADFNNSTDLEWRYIVRKGCVWKIEEAAPDYVAQSAEEQAILEMIDPEHATLDNDLWQKAQKVGEKTRSLTQSKSRR